MTRSSNMGRIIAVAVVAVVLSAAAFAQFNASIQGTVTDQSGAVIPNATVTATEQGTGKVSTAQTTADGLYRISGLPPGTYSITVTANTFATHTDTDVNVRAEEPRGWNVQLSPASTKQNVTVSAETVPELQTENANLEGTITTAQVENLPKFGRDPYELLRLAPGVFGQGAHSANGGAVNFPNSTGPGGSNTSLYQTENQVAISTDGQRITSNSYTIDGVSVNSQTWGGAAVITPSPDDIKEMNIVTTPLTADVGASSGATVQVITKSGTNKFHGGAFFQYQDPSLNAFSGYAGPASLNAKDVKDEDKWRQYGAHIGGPIKKDKLFFFFDWEALHSNESTVSAPTYIFSPQFYQMVQTARPNTFASTITSVANGQARVYNVLTPSCAVFTASNWPCQVVNGGLDIGSPYGTNGTYDPVFSGINANQAGGGLDGIPDLEYVQERVPSTATPNQYNGRVDYVRGAHQFAWTGIFDRAHETNPADGSIPAPAYDLSYSPHNTASMLAWVWTISPSLLNDLRANVTRWAYSTVTGSGVNWGIPYAYVQNMPGPVGNINLTPTTSPQQPADFAENTYNITDNLSKVTGRHVLKFGASVIREQNNDNTVGQNRPAYAFATPWNFVNNAPIYEGVYVNPVDGSLSSGEFHYRRWDYGLYAQDDFKVRPNLTVNLGLRWDYFGPLTEENDRLTNLFVTSDPTTGLADAYVKPINQYYGGDHKNFGPRIGFAWSPWSDAGFVVRGGAGIAYDRVPGSLLDNSRQNPPFAASFGLCCGTAPTEFGTPYDNNLIVLSTSTNSVYGYSVSPNITTLMPLGTNNLPSAGAQFGSVQLYGAPQNFPTPRVYLWQLQIQKEFPWKLVFEVGYQGSATRHEIRLLNLNYVYPVGNPAINGAFFAEPDVNGSYNGLVTSLRRSYRDLQFTFNYRWSKSLDDLSYGGPGFVTNQTWPQDNKLNYGPSDFDATHAVNFSTIYTTPRVGAKNGFADRVLGDWQVTGIFTYNSGLPWTPVSFQSCVPLGASQCLSPYRPSAVLQTPVYSNSYAALTTPGVNFPGGGAAYFNQTAGTPAIGRNSFRGPDYRSVDMSLGKSFRITEGTTIQLNAIALNVFNLVNLLPFQFGGSNTNVGDPTFGEALGSTAGRVMQLQARFSF